MGIRWNQRAILRGSHLIFDRVASQFLPSSCRAWTHWPKWRLSRIRLPPSPRVWDLRSWPRHTCRTIAMSSRCSSNIGDALLTQKPDTSVIHGKNQRFPKQWDGHLLGIHERDGDIAATRRARNELQ